MKTVPATDIAIPIGEIEKIPSSGRPAFWSASLATRNAGAPMIVIAVPSDAANEIGISSLDAGIPLCSRDRFIATGTMIAVVVTWCVKADSTATLGMLTASARVRLPPAARPIQLPIVSETPVWYSAPVMTKIPATTTAGSLANPATASSGLSTRVAASATMISTATTSFRSRSVINTPIAATRMAR